MNPGEISWLIKSSDGGETLKSRSRQYFTNKVEPFSQYSQRICLNKAVTNSDCFKFIILDKGEDGLTKYNPKFAKHGNPGYTLSVKTEGEWNVVRKTDGEKSYKRQSTEFGLCATPTAIPTTTPTGTPTVSPTIGIPDGSVLCPKLPPFAFCNCNDDCTLRPPLCSCEEAEACCSPPTGTPSHAPTLSLSPTILCAKKEKSSDTFFLWHQSKAAPTERSCGFLNSYTVGVRNRMCNTLFPFRDVGDLKSAKEVCTFSCGVCVGFGDFDTSSAIDDNYDYDDEVADYYEDMDDDE